MLQEGVREFKPDRIIFSFSYSVYGLDAHLPYSEQVGGNRPDFNVCSYQKD